MNRKKKTGSYSWRSIPGLLIGGAVVAVFFAGVGYVWGDVWLASTQWLLVAGVLALFAVYARLG